MGGSLGQGGAGGGGGGGADLTPGVETLTGDTWNGAPVYRQHFSGTTPADTATAKLTSSNDIEKLLYVEGFITATDGNRFPPNVWHINDTAKFIIAWVGGSSTNDIQIESHGASFASQAYEITAYYLKL